MAYLNRKKWPNIARAILDFSLLLPIKISLLKLPLNLAKAFKNEEEQQLSLFRQLKNRDNYIEKAKDKRSKINEVKGLGISIITFAKLEE